MSHLSVVDSPRENAEERLKVRLAAEEGRGLLRFLTCGSVDDGKSTLIGRLLVDSAQVYEDQLLSAERDSKRHGTDPGGGMDLALLVDGLCPGEARPCARAAHQLHLFLELRRLHHIVGVDSPEMFLQFSQRALQYHTIIVYD